MLVLLICLGLAQQEGGALKTKYGVTHRSHDVSGEALGHICSLELPTVIYM